MMNNEKAARDAANIQDGKEKTTVAGSFDSINNSITDMGRKQGHVESFLPHGEQNAIPTVELVRLTGYRDARAMQAEIERERAAGALILSKCADGGGYYLPCSRAEIARYEATVRRRALSTLRTLKTARQALREIDGQERMEVDNGR